MAEKKTIIYSKDDILFTVKQTEGKGSGEHKYVAPIPKKSKFKVDIYLKDGRTFSYITPANYVRFNDGEALEEAILRLSLYVYEECEARISFPIVRCCVISTCYSGKNDRERWSCVYWSNGKQETAAISSYLMNFIATDRSVNRTLYNWTFGEE